MSEQPHAAHGDDHGHGHGHGSPFIQHHYDDAQHQFDSGKLGMWIFLAQEVLFFSALFVAYIVYRHNHPEIYAYAHKYLDTKMGAINTAVLIVSSLTAAWAVRAAQLRQTKLLIGLLAATIACACGFLVIKYFEYTHKIHEQILFGRYFDPCVSSGGTSLLTRSNECPGTKTTVVWDFGTGGAKAGCFADAALDLDPKRPHVQAECSVFEVTGSMAQGPDGKEQFIEKGRKEITARCFDPALGPTGGLPTTADGAHASSSYPCWKTGAQPNVCKGGWFFTWHCTGPICAAPFGGEGPFATDAACRDARTAKETELKGQGTPALTACALGGASGIIVEYGDHAHREDVRIAATCKAPAAPAAEDPYATRAPTLVLGQQSTTTEPKATAHDLKEARYAGPPPEHTNMFFTIYFAMTGLHGIHVLIGVFVFIWLLVRAIKGHFTPDYFGPIDFAALYWHIVDLIWIFLFPLLYLIH